MSLVFKLKLPRRDYILELDGNLNKKTIGIFGPSGAGKTSFFMMLCGLLKPAEGYIKLNGRMLTDTDNKVFIAPDKRRTGVVFQEQLLFPHLNIKKNLLFAEHYNRRQKISFRKTVELLDLGSLLDSIPGRISGGEQQRAAIGRALLSDPELLLLDEPFSAIDSSSRKNILPYLKRVRDELDIPMLVISHDLSDILKLTNEIYLIDKGRCTGHGSMLDLIEENRNFASGTRHVNHLELFSPEKLPGGLCSCNTAEQNELRITIPFVPDTDCFSAVLHPDEISLSLNAVKDISIQNQLPGIIRKIIRLNGSSYCVVDAGISLLVKVTADAVESMGLKPGIKVFCLFKANSLHL